MSERAQTVFLGSGEFAVPSVATLAEQPYLELVGVVTAPSRPAGRGREPRQTPVARWAADQGLPTMTPPRLRDPAAIGELADLQPDLLVLADYGQLVPGAVLELPAHGALNVHPSLLPRHRGAAPIPAAILEGDAVTGVTVMLMDPGLDTGPIVAQRALELTGNEVAPDLERRLAHMGAALLGEILEPWLRNEIEPRPQPAEGATLTRPLRREDGRLDPSRPVAQLERQVRAYQPWPGAFVEIGGTRLVVWRAAVASRPVAAPEVVAQGPALMQIGPDPALVTDDGALLLLDVQPAGGRRMAGAAWLRGRPILAVAALPADQG